MLPTRRGDSSASRETRTELIRSSFRETGEVEGRYAGVDIEFEKARWFVLDNNLARIPWFLDRELYFQTFDRFYRAFQGFLLGLHLSRSSSSTASKAVPSP